MAFEIRGHNETVRVVQNFCCFDYLHKTNKIGRNCLILHLHTPGGETLRPRVGTF